MPDLYLRHVPTGVVYVSQPAFALRPDFVPCNLDGSDVVDVDAVEVPVVTPRTRRVGKQAIPDAPMIDEAALSADASRGLPG